MHISEGVLSGPVLAGGWALATVGTTLGLKRLDYDRLMTVAILSAAFFVASLIHVPIGPVSAHLILNGLLGAILGLAAFPAICVALLLQAVLFQYGGLVVRALFTGFRPVAAPHRDMAHRGRVLLRFFCRAAGRTLYRHRPGPVRRSVYDHGLGHFPGPFADHGRGRRDHHPGGGFSGQGAP